MPRTGGYRYGMEHKAYWTQRSKEQLSESFSNAQEVEAYIENTMRNGLFRFSREFTELVKPFIKNDVLDTVALQNAMISDVSFMAQYQHLTNNIYNFCQNMKVTEQEKVLKMLEEQYTDNVISTFKMFNKPTAGVELLNPKLIETAVKTPWTADGREFSDRIWMNLDLMNQKLRATISQSLTEGRSIQKSVKEFRDIFGNTTYNTKRIIRTETLACYAKASVDSYKELGVEELEILAEADACDECSGVDGSIIEVNEAQLGINIPPIHPNCRCCVKPRITRKWLADNE